MENIIKSYKLGIKALDEIQEVIDVKYCNGGVTVETVYGYKVKGKIVIAATQDNLGFIEKDPTNSKLWY